MLPVKTDPGSVISPTAFPIKGKLTVTASNLTEDSVTINLCGNDIVLTKKEALKEDPNKRSKSIPFTLASMENLSKFVNPVVSVKSKQVNLSITSNQIQADLLTAGIAGKNTVKVNDTISIEYEISESDKPLPLYKLIYPDQLLLSVKLETDLAVFKEPITVKIAGFQDVQIVNDLVLPPLLLPRTNTDFFLSKKSIQIELSESLREPGDVSLIDLLSRDKVTLNVSEGLKLSVSRFGGIQVPEVKYYRMVYTVCKFHPDDVMTEISDVIPANVSFVSFKYRKPFRFLGIFESSEKEAMEEFAEKLGYPRKQGSVLGNGELLYHPSCYWETSLLPIGYRKTVNLRQLTASDFTLEDSGISKLEDFFIANSIWQVRDNLFMDEKVIDEIEALHGEGGGAGEEGKESINASKSKTAAAEIASKYNFQPLSAFEPYQARSPGRELHARLRSNAVEAPFNVQGETYLTRLRQGDPKLVATELTLAPWTHKGKSEKKGEFMDTLDFKRYTKTVQKKLSIQPRHPGHSDLWRRPSTTQC
jgi:hypothetical protein